MYAHRGLLAAETTKQLKLAQLAALRGREFVAVAPVVEAPAVKAKGVNPLAAMVRSLVNDPKAVPSAAPKISTPLPAHLQKAKGRAEKERSRSAPIPKPVVPPVKAPPAKA
eukprot:13377761-Heterocapsa_arctica.AAC.1